MNHIAAIHVIRKQLALSDDDYRYQLKVATTSEAFPAGKDSCKAMTHIQLAKARAHFDRMALASGVAKPAAAQSTRPKPSEQAAPLVRRIRAQLISLGSKPDSYADGIAKQMLGADCPKFFEWCHLPDLHKLSQALGVHQARTGAPTQ